MANDRPTPSSSFGSLRPTRDDRIVSSSADVTSDLETSDLHEGKPRRGWTIHLAIICAYLAPMLALLVPLPSPDARLMFSAAVGVIVAAFAFFVLDRSQRHRFRLLIYGGCVGAVFLFYSLKSSLGF